MKVSRFAALALALSAVLAGATLLVGPLQPRRTPPAPIGQASASEAPRANRRALFPEPRAAPEPPRESSVSPWIALNNDATSLLARGELELAVESFERCVEGDPNQTVYQRNLVEALVRLARAKHEAGDLGSALGHLSRALELGAERDDVQVLRAIRERWRKEEELERDHWLQDSELFVLSYDTARADILHRWHEVLVHLERTYESLRVWFGVDPVRDHGRAPFRVVLYNQEEFDRLTGLGDWAGGVFDGIVRVSIEDLAQDAPRWRGILTHELVHAFVQECGGPQVPGWLNEGLAQLFEGPSGRAASARASLVGKELFSLGELQGSLLSWRDPASIARAYAESLAFVAYLQSTYADEVLRRMIQAAGRSESPALAFETWARVSLEQAFEDWKQGL